MASIVYIFSTCNYITKRFFEFSTMCLVAARPKKRLLVMIICEEKHGRILPQVSHRAKMRSLSVAKSKLAQARPPEVSLSLGATRAPGLPPRPCAGKPGVRRSLSIWRSLRAWPRRREAAWTRRQHLHRHSIWYSYYGKSFGQVIPIVT